jgi:hypothetical protein
MAIEEIFAQIDVDVMLLLFEASDAEISYFINQNPEKIKPKLGTLTVLPKSSWPLTHLFNITLGSRSDVLVKSIPRIIIR